MVMYSTHTHLNTQNATNVSSLDAQATAQSDSSRRQTRLTVKALKQVGQDFEFYPTTQAQIDVVTGDVLSLLETHSFDKRHRHDVRLLDVGAGDGRVLQAMTKALAVHDECESMKQFAIEKATVHTDTYRSKDITLLGTDFDETNFISKNADIAFCNPPYSQFSRWMQALISQLNFKVLYAVIPERWQLDGGIAEAIKQRGITTTKVLAESDFFDADRQARARVHVVRFAFNDFEKETERHNQRCLRRDSYRYRPTIGLNATCPFQQFIENELGLKKTYSETTNKFYEHAEKERIRKQMQTEGTPCFEVVKSRGVLWALLDSYERELAHVLDEYKKISALDAALLQELGVKYDSIRDGVKEKLFGYRNVYWGLLFDELDTLSSRLTQSNREKMLNTLKANALDFTYTNAVYIVSFAVEMANELIEESLIEVYKDLTSEAAISRHYVSNQHMYRDDWRHNHDNPNQQAKYLLDYRFISSHWNNFGSYSYEKGLNDGAKGFCNDLMVVFKLLGYANIGGDCDYRSMSAGDKLVITGIDPQGKQVVLVHIRFYQNGNRHLKFNQQAMLRFNVTASRLLDWVRSKAEFEAEAEVKKSIDEATWRVGDSLKVAVSSVLALTNKKVA